ncbi:MAG: histidine kinase [Rubrivivax sp.]|nr:histidine kinase [Rubrivivax sp.]
MNSAHDRIDWSQLWYPGRKQPFSADELARAGSDGFSATLVAVSTMTFAIVAFLVLLIAPSSQTARLTGLLVAMAVLTHQAARWLWKNPWRRRLLLVTLGVSFVLGLLVGGIRVRTPDGETRNAAGLLLGVCGGVIPVLLWFLAVWRANQIESRLREQDEREKAIEMARRLAAAQVEPHFLFNTLASLQHWVQTKDDRAGPLLASLTGYLRATLPLFNRPLVAAGQELVAVRRYLEVMQSRLGGRLTFGVAVEAALEQALLPPGLLLTLVENAVLHGIEPQLAGGRVDVAARRDGAAVAFTVTDTGAGLAPGQAEGTGLANLRQSLQLAFGPAGTLTLAVPPEGGCRAEIRCPFRTEEPA